jgi:hypothetical protein
MQYGWTTEHQKFVKNSPQNMEKTTFEEKMVFLLQPILALLKFGKIYNPQVIEITDTLDSREHRGGKGRM